jgi:hypothetical protein
MFYRARSVHVPPMLLLSRSMQNYTRRVDRLSTVDRGPIGSKHILPSSDRYGYICARALGLDIPPRLERLMQLWRAQNQRQGRGRQGIPQAARDRLLAAEPEPRSPEEQAADDREMREAAERTIAKYS